MMMIMIIIIIILIMIINHCIVFKFLIFSKLLLFSARMFKTSRKNLKKSKTKI